MIRKAAIQARRSPADGDSAARLQGALKRTGINASVSMSPATPVTHFVTVATEEQAGEARELIAARMARLVPHEDMIQVRAEGAYDQAERVGRFLQLMLGQHARVRMDQADSSRRYTAVIEYQTDGRWFTNPAEDLQGQETLARLRLIAGMEIRTAIDPDTGLKRPEIHYHPPGETGSFAVRLSPHQSNGLERAPSSPSELPVEVLEGQEGLFSLLQENDIQVLGLDRREATPGTLEVTVGPFWNGEEEQTLAALESLLDSDGRYQGLPVSIAVLEAAPGATDTSGLDGLEEAAATLEVLE